MENYVVNIIHDNFVGHLQCASLLCMEKYVMYDDEQVRKQLDIDDDDDDDDDR